MKELKLRNETEKPKSQILMTGITIKLKFNEEICGVLFYNIPLSKLSILPSNIFWKNTRNKSYQTNHHYIKIL